MTIDPARLREISRELYEQRAFGKLPSFQLLLAVEEALEQAAEQMEGSEG